MKLDEVESNGHIFIRETSRCLNCGVSLADWFFSEDADKDCPKAGK